MLFHNGVVVELVGDHLQHVHTTPNDTLFISCMLPVYDDTQVLPNTSDGPCRCSYESICVQVCIICMHFIIFLYHFDVTHRIMQVATILEYVLLLHYFVLICILLQ